MTLCFGVSLWILSPDNPEFLPEDSPVYGYEIVHIFPHDRTAFTEGLVFSDGVFFEGTGLYGRSTLRKVRPETGEIISLQRLPDEYFGEGVTVSGETVFQLTEQAGIGFLYDSKTFEVTGTFPCSLPGWGLTHDGRHLIVSDGSNRLTFIDPGNFRPLRQIEVRADGVPVPFLNELEYVEGEIYANVWPTDRIARISPHTGEVTGWIELAGILSPSDRMEVGLPENAGREGQFSSSWTCLNGIAYDPEGKRLFVTGKLWPTLYEIRLTPPRGPPSGSFDGHELSSEQVSGNRSSPKSSTGKVQYASWFTSIPSNQSAMSGKDGETSVGEV
ncbi:MAG: glutaminyl-peptide cyclotransferase [Methanoregulaceae archaeon]|nr:glutaminyl-peptide cyclotransferase [Methanoregulaceae archaeon]